MRVRTFFLFASAMTLATAGISFVGCGSDDPPATPPGTDDGGGDGTTADVNTNPDDSGTGENPVCKPAGQACANSVDCCSANCNTKTGLCDAPTGICKAPGESCAQGVECCTVSCIGGKCADRLCVSDNQKCTSDAECCGGSCTGGVDGGAKTCKALNNSCKTSGNKCAGNSECCSKVCRSGVCDGHPSFCTQTGDVCVNDFECCGGDCNKAAGANLGVCQVTSAPGTTGCLVAGQVCSTATTGDGGLPECGGECCSRSCAPYGNTGVIVCQPPSGCRPTGEVCRDNKDCCGFGGQQGVTGVGTCVKEAGNTTGRCDNGNACRPAGAICKLADKSCNAENNCCSGNVNQDPTVCQQDLLGIPRCTFVGNCADAGSKAGLACATSVDCCGLPCVPNPNGSSPAFICGGQCIPTGGACTSSADCCPGTPCVAPPGSTSGVCGGKVESDGGVSGSNPEAGTGSDSGSTTTPPPGTCSYAGQGCGTSGDCCAGLSCNSGRCQISIK